MEKERNSYKIGIYLERALNQKKWKISDLAEASGIDKDMLQKYLVNRRSPSYSSIEIIANAMELPVDYFIHDTFDVPKEAIIQNEHGYELRAHIANSDLMINIKKDDEKSYIKAFKALQKMNIQIFNSLTPKGKEKMILAMYRSLLDDLYPIAFEEKNKESFWKYVFDDRGYWETSRDADKRTISMIKSIVDDTIEKLLDREDNDSEQMDTINDILSSTAVKLNNIDKYNNNEENDE